MEGHWYISRAGVGGGGWVQGMTRHTEQGTGLWSVAGSGWE